MAETRSKIWWALFFLVGVLLGFLVKTYTVPALLNPPVEVRENSAEYSYINPLVFSRVSKRFYTVEFEPFVAKVTAAIKANTHDGVQGISVYYRDLNNGHWTGIDEDKVYHPSSMLKVLGLMSYYRRAEEEGPQVLSKKIYYKATNDPGQHYKPESIYTEGYYTVEELLKQMITQSDNNVLEALDNEDKNNSFNRAYRTFQLPLSSNIDELQGFMSSRSYSALFRALYNATYLSREDSEKALELLTKTEFKKGLVAGIPENIVVAHKFGEHTYELVSAGISQKELHDCGIVYYPEHPYLVCVMTQGSDFSSLEKAIANLSKVVYDYVDKEVKK